MISDINKTRLAIIIGFIVLLGPLAIDMYLSGFAQIAQSIHTDTKHIAFTLTIYFVGISIGQLITGALLDRFGRKTPLLIGLSIFIVFSMACAFAQNIEILVFFRFLQALGGSVGMVIYSVIVRDLFDTRDSAKMFSAIVLVMGIAPIIAPSLGSLFLVYWGWRSIFIFIGIMAIFCMLVVRYYLPETFPKNLRTPIKIKQVKNHYLKILRNKHFFFTTIGGGFMMGILFTYITSAPLLMIDVYQLSETEFGVVYALIASGFILGSQVNRWLLNHIGIYRLIYIEMFLIIVLSLLSLVVLTMIGINIWLLSSILYLIMFMIGGANPNITALSLHTIKERMGVASAINGSVKMIFSALASALIGIYYDATLYPIIIFLLTLAILTVFCLWISTKNVENYKTV